MSATESTVISMRLPVESGRRLKKFAKRHGWTASDTSARLVEEGLRRAEFAYIDFRDTAAGRQTYIQGSRVQVWQIMMLLRDYKGDVAAVAEHLEWPVEKVQAGINYGDAFPEEIEEALAENDAMDFASLRRMSPNAVEFVVKG